MSSKQKRATSLLAVLIVLGAFVAVAFVGYQFVSQWQSLKTLNIEKAALSKQLDTENGKTAELTQDLKDVNTDGFVVRMAHEILGWVKPGEIKIVDKNK